MYTYRWILFKKGSSLTNMIYTTKHKQHLYMYIYTTKHKQHLYMYKDDIYNQTQTTLIHVQRWYIQPNTNNTYTCTKMIYTTKHKQHLYMYKDDINKVIRISCDKAWKGVYSLQAVIALVCPGDNLLENKDETKTLLALFAIPYLEYFDNCFLVKMFTYTWHVFVVLLW